MSISSDDEKIANELGKGAEAKLEPEAYPNLPLERSSSEDGPATFDDPKQTRLILRKLDWRVLPICALLYLFSSLDRTAIGNAKLAGMNKDLHLTQSQYATALCVFFLFYSIFEVPSNLILKRFGAKKYLPTLVVAWGLITTLSAFVQDAGGLIAVRCFLGAAEAGLFPGISMFLTTLYPRSFIQLRLGLFFAAATLAGSFGGLIAYALTPVYAGGLRGWRWIYIVEGLFTIAAGVLSYFVLIDSAEEAKCLTSEEKAYLTDRLNYDGTETKMNNALQRRFLWDALRSWQVYRCSGLAFLIQFPLTSTALFLPTLLGESLKYDVLTAQLLTVPVYAVACVFVVLSAFFADRLQNRTLFICLGGLFTGVGSLLCLLLECGRGRYAAMFLTAIGAFSAFPSAVALLAQNMGGPTKRGAGVAMMLALANCHAYAVSNIFPPHLGPRFTLPFAINVAASGALVALALLHAFLLKRANRAKLREIDEGRAAMIPRDELADMGDLSPYFVYRM